MESKACINMKDITENRSQELSQDEVHNQHIELKRTITTQDGARLDIIPYKKMNIIEIESDDKEEEIFNEVGVMGELASGPTVVRTFFLVVVVYIYIYIYIFF